MAAGEDDRIIPEERLRCISRSIRSFLPSSQNTSPDLDQQIIDFNLLLDHVFHTSAVSNLDVTHRVAAWNTLCSLIDQALDSPLPELRELVWVNGIWDRAFELYLHHAQTARPKSSRQLLATLTNALRKSKTQDLTDVKLRASRMLASSLVDFEDPPSAKVGAQLLSQLLAKDVIDVTHVFEAFNRLAPTANSPSSSEEVLTVFFQWLGKGDFGSTIAHLVSVFLDKSSNAASASSTAPIWSIALRKAFAQGSVNIDDLRAHVLPVLFKRDFGDFVSFLHTLGMKTSDKPQETAIVATSDELLHASLQTAKELGLLEETEEDVISQTESNLRLPLCLISQLLLGSSRSGRITALHLLVASHSATRPFTRKTLALIRNGLDIAFADVDADFRGDVFSVFQRLIDRFRGVTAVLARQNPAVDGPQGNTESREVAADVLAYHRAFLVWLPGFLSWQLCPTASYQRHISGLKCLMTLAKSGLDQSIPERHHSKSALGATRWPFDLQVISSETRRLLLDLVLDPFDDVRLTASEILKCNSSSLGGGSRRSASAILGRAEDMMLASGRADHADGVAHLYELSSGGESDPSEDSSQPSVLLGLLEKLENMLRIARDDLTEAVNKYPIHGLLTSLRYVVIQQAEGSASLTSRFSDDLQQIWQVVKPVLCNDAPEGYTPDDVDEGLDSTKETLSFCWRGLKEASLLMGTLVARQQTQEIELQNMSDLCFTQLAELRHRGAFSTVANTWMTCCMRCKHLKSSSEDSMLDVWYSKVLHLLRNNVTINTRRSAGIPSLLCGVLIADNSNILLAKAIIDLEAIARQAVDPSSAEEGSLPQVHAMNCLKDLLKNTRLGERSEKYIPTALQLAADALRSDAWAIRNCGLMLFRAVIDRLLGTDQSHFDHDQRTQKHISVHQHPQLIDVVLGLLPSSQDALAGSTRFEGVFPALQLLQHTQVPTSRLAELKVAVQNLTASTSWHVRDKAAESLAALLSRMQPLQAFQSSQELLHKALSRQNALHGALLTAMHYVTRLKRAIQTSSKSLSLSSDFWDDELENLVSDFTDKVWSISQIGACFAAQAAAVDVLRAFEGLPSLLGSITPAPHHVQCLDQLSPQELQRFPDAALRQAVARLTAQRLYTTDQSSEKDVSSTVEQILQLARHDQNACEYLLKAFDTTNSSSKDNCSRIIFSVCLKILKSDLGIQLKCEAQSVLLAMPIASWPRHDPSSKIEGFEVHYLAENGCNQRYADQWLQLRAIKLNDETARNGKAFREEVRSWVNDCTTAVDDEGLHTREAASLAIDRLDSFWRLLSDDESLYDLFARMCIAVYELLNDDDEDTRLRAASAAQRILATQSTEQIQEMEPITAGRKLLAFCVSQWPSNPTLAEVAFKRAFDVSLAATPSVADQLELLSRSDTALFIEEKQNLYIDDAREVWAWSRVVQGLSPSPVAQKLNERLAAWTLDALEALSQYAETRADGALGWSSKPDVFKLVLQVVYAAEVLQSIIDSGDGPSTTPAGLEQRLSECAAVFEKADVSPLLRAELARIAKIGGHKKTGPDSDVVQSNLLSEETMPWS